MLIEGKLFKSGKFWGVEIECINVYTQGNSRKNALAMAESAVEDLANVKGFRVKIHSAKNRTFRIGAGEGAENQKIWTALCIQRLREREGLTLREMADRLGFSSITSYARYEQRKVEPSISRFYEIITAIDPRLKAVLITRA